MTFTETATDVFQWSNSTTISDAPTPVGYAGLRTVVAHDWTSPHWQSTQRVAGFNVYQGTTKLNHRLIVSGNTRYSFRVHAVVRHAVLVAVPLQ